MGRLMLTIAAFFAAILFVQGRPMAEEVACKTLDRAQPWNQPADGSVHPLSSELSKWLWNNGGDRPGNFNMLPSYAVYVAEPKGGVYKVQSRRGNLNGETAPFKDGWQPYHSDRQIIILGPQPGITYEFIGAKVDKAKKLVRATRADRLTADKKDATGRAGNPPSRGIGIPYIHMLILDCEIRAGRIEHALSLRVGRPKCDEAWYPATKVENHPDCVPGGMPIGARFVLRFPPKKVDAWAAKLKEKGGAPLEAFGRAVAAALQTYGFYITDNGGGAAGFDMQHPETLTKGNPLRQLGVENENVVRDLLDGLIEEGDIRLVAEKGPRVFDPR